MNTEMFASLAWGDYKKHMTSGASLRFQARFGWARMTGAGAALATLVWVSLWWGAAIGEVRG